MGKPKTTVSVVQVQHRQVEGANPAYPVDFIHRPRRRWGTALLAVTLIPTALFGAGTLVVKADISNPLDSGPDCPGPRSPESIPTCVEFPRQGKPGKTVKGMGYWCVKSLAVMTERPKDIGVELCFVPIPEKFHQAMPKKADGSPNDPNVFASNPARYITYLNTRAGPDIKKSCRGKEMTNIMDVVQDPEHAADLLERHPIAFPAADQMPAQPVTVDIMTGAESVYQRNFGTESNKDDGNNPNIYFFVRDPAQNNTPVELYCADMSS